VAEGFLARRGEGLPARVQAGMVEEIVGLLNDPTFGALFASGSRAEVPIVAELPDPSGRSLPLRLNGQIDRLAVTPVEVLIVDYKTNRVPPIDVADVPIAYLVQLAAYRAALADIYPGRRLRAALLWTAAPRLMEIPAALLDGYGARLWELATATLDLEGPAP
jgi:ATP-dependent helicase/nuclease subunit A